MKRHLQWEPNTLYEIGDTVLWMDGTTRKCLRKGVSGDTQPIDLAPPFWETLPNQFHCLDQPNLDLLIYLREHGPHKVKIGQGSSLDCAPDPSTWTGGRLPALASMGYVRLAPERFGPVSPPTGQIVAYLTEAGEFAVQGMDAKSGHQGLMIDIREGLNIPGLTGWLVWDPLLLDGDIWVWALREAWAENPDEMFDRTDGGHHDRALELYMAAGGKVAQELTRDQRRHMRATRKKGKR